MSDTVATLRLRADSAGYRLGERDVDGFADDRELTLPQRRRVARWATRYGEPSVEQRALLDRPVAQASSASREAAALASAWRSPLVTHLTTAQLALARVPGSHPELTGRDYPLTLGEVATLAGCTDRRIRHWHDLSLLPARRDRNEQKWFGPGAVIRAMWLAQANQHTISTLGSLADERGLAPLLAAFGEILHDVASRSVPLRLDMEHLADEMQAVSVRLVVG